MYLEYIFASNGCFTNVLVVFGLFFIIIGVALVILSVFVFVRELLDNIRCWWIVHRRYYKKPTAKCYCRDCKKFNVNTGVCADSCNSRHMSPGWFCCFAEPLKPSEFHKREKEYEKK